MRYKDFFLPVSVIIIFASLSFFLPPSIPVIYAQSPDVIQTQETNISNVTADLVQCLRKKGVLTVKIRVRNTGDKTSRVYWKDVKKTVYLMDAENQKKYYLLKDTKGEYIYSGDPWDIPGGESRISWFKFPAPPPEVKEITVILPQCAPFEDVPITDK